MAVKLIKGDDKVLIVLSWDDYRMIKLALKHYKNSLTTKLLQKLRRQEES